MNKILLLNSLIWIVIKSTDILSEFGIATSGAAHSQSGSTVHLTLLYDSIIYKCDVIPNAQNTEFTCIGSDSFIGEGCTGVNTQEMFIENLDYIPEIDAVKIDYIFMTDSSGNKHIVDTNNVCFDRDDCGTNTGLINIDAETVDKSVNSYTYDCS